MPKPDQVAAEPLTTTEDRLAPAPLAHDRVDDAGIDSFPASDPPGWWSGS